MPRSRPRSPTIAREPPCAAGNHEACPLLGVGDLRHPGIHSAGGSRQARHLEADMTDIFTFLGIKPAVMIAGLAGGVLRALSGKHYKLREMIASPVCGALAAA